MVAFLEFLPPLPWIILFAPFASAILITFFFLKSPKAAAVTSIIGSAYTSISFLKSLVPGVEARTRPRASALGRGRGQRIAELVIRLCTNLLGALDVGTGAPGGTDSCRRPRLSGGGSRHGCAPCPSPCHLATGPSDCLRSSVHALWPRGYVRESWTRTP